MMGWYDNTTSSSTTTYVVVRIGRSSYSTQPGSTINETSAFSDTPYAIELPRLLLSPEENRNAAAAKAHADFTATAVRMPPPGDPPPTRARYGYYMGPRFSAHTGTRGR